MSHAVTVSYKELQKEAKRYNIPANMKRSFLESAIEAVVENNRKKLNSIVQFHRSQRKRRAHSSARSVKREAKTLPSSTLAIATPPVRTSIHSSQECLYESSDDDDSSNFHPDRTSTPRPNQSSPVAVNLNHYTKDCSDVRYYANNLRTPSCNVSNYLISASLAVPSSGALHSRGDREQLLKGTPIISHSIDVYGTNNANFGFVGQNYCSVQTSANNVIDTRPVSKVYQRSPEVVCVTDEYPTSFSSTPKPRSLPNNPELVDSTKRSYIIPEASCSLNVEFIDNFRTSPIHFATRIDRAQSENVHANVADGARVYAEFNSDSDAETLSLTEEIVNFFSPYEESKKMPFTSTNTLPFLPRPDCNVNPSSLLDHLVFKNRNNTTTWNGDDNERFRDPGVADFLPLPVQVAATTDRYNLLPSINTLLPEHRSQAYLQESYCESTPSFNANSPVGENNNAASISTWERENTDATPAFSGVPYLQAISRHSNGVLASYSGSYSNRNAEQRFSAESSISSSVIQESPVTLNFTSPFEVFQEAMHEIRKCDTNTFKSANCLVSKTKDPAACETSVVVKRETISIQGLMTDSDAKKDIFCDSFEMKMHHPVEKSIALSTICRNAIQESPALVCEAVHSNLFADSVPIRSSYRSCKNKLHGCNVIMNNEELICAHHKECFYQVVHCPADECNWCGVMRTLTDHIYVSHKSDLNIGNDLIYVMNRRQRDAPFTTYFQLHEGTIFVITLHVNEKKCIAAMQYLPEVETVDYRNKCIQGTMDLVCFGNKAETKCWKGIVHPYFENNKSAYQKGNILKIAIGNSKNVVVRVLIQ